MGFLEERDLSDVPTIPEFYKDKTILITGGSGFIGKVLIEKLLYSCTDLKRIYLLMRTKKNVSSKDRLAPLFAKACFDRLRNERPGVFEAKVFVVAGDVMEPGFGLSEEDKTLLIENVNIVFHVAASVRFDDTLKYSVQLNLRGTVEIVEMAKKMKDLSAFVHVSTSYSNTNRDPIEEVLYPPLADWRETLSICETVDDHMLRILTPKYIEELPNTYTFCKQLAEHVVSENKRQLPAVIVRPSIVISSEREPVAGWIESFNGPVGIFVACGKGIMRSIHTKPDIVLDFITVDACVRNIVAAAWIRGTKKLEPSDDVTIYNCCAGRLHGILMKDMVEMGKQIGEKIPLNGMLWFIGGTITTNEKLHYVKVLFQHLLPALLVDTILWLLGRKTMLTTIQRRIYIADLALCYYKTQQWTFDNKNFIALRSSLKEKDRDSFLYQIEDIDVANYFTNCILGAKKYLLKDGEDLSAGKIHCRRMKIIHNATQVIFYGLVIYLLYTKLAPYYEIGF